MYWLVGLGGAIGSVLRFAVYEFTVSISDNSILTGTFICNIIGSFFLAWLVVCISIIGKWSEMIRLTFGVGLLGSFTTFSACSSETFDLFIQGRWIFGLVYVSCIMIGGWTAAWLGWSVGHACINRSSKGDVGP